MDLKIVKFLNRLGRGTALDLLTRFVSNVPFLSVLWIAITACVFFFDQQNGMRITIAMSVSIGLHLLLTAGLLKRGLGYKKNRPYIAHPSEIVPLGERQGDSSFPSSHMSANLSLVSVLVFFYPAIWPAAIIWVMLMAFARLHNGMHYLSDALLGALLGVLYGVSGIYFGGLVMSFDFLKNLI